MYPVPEQKLLSPRESPKQGWPLFAKGFRIFFVLAALHAALMIPLWLVVYLGVLDVGEYFLPSSWHAHEMVFGSSCAVITGFLLTAASNWTKRETATGPALAALSGVWLLGRIAPFLAGRIPDLAVAVLSLAFLPLVALALARVVFGARSKRNYGVVAIVGALFGVQLVVHIGALRGDILWELGGSRVGVDLVVLMILVIGGRVIPLFTRNRTKAEGIRSHPWLDGASIASAIALTIADAMVVQGVLLTTLAGLAAFFAFARMVHWGFRPALRVPLLWVLHLGFLFVPLGFATRAVAALVPKVGSSTALHLLTAGAIGVLTLGMMARVALGHTGRALVAPKVITVAFGLVVLAAILRVSGPWIGGAFLAGSLHASATCWTLAFLLFLVRLGPSLFQARPDGRAG